MARRIHASALRQLLVDRGLKVDQLAKALGIDRSSAYRCIRGTDPLSEDRWGAIQAILAHHATTGAKETVSPKSFIFYDEQPDPEPDPEPAAAPDYDDGQPDPEPAVAPADEAA